MQKQLILIVCAVAVVVAGISLIRSCGSRGGAGPTEAEWVCLECGHVYVFTEAALEKHYKDHYGEPLSCPECGGTEVYPASRCPHCGEAYGKPADGNRCPHCGEPLPARPTEPGR